MSVAAERVIEKIPFPLIVYSMISGLIVTALSPARFLLPQTLFLTALESDPTRALSNLVLLGVISFSIGFVLNQLAYPMLAGQTRRINQVERSQNLNNALRRFVNRLLRIETRENNQNVDDPNALLFQAWLRNGPYLHYGALLNLEGAVVDALIVGSEMSLILNVIHNAVWYIQEWTQFVPSRLYVYLSAPVIWQMLIPSLIICALSIAYNHYYFRNYLHTRWRGLRQLATNYAYWIPFERQYQEPETLTDDE